MRSLITRPFVYRFPSFLMMLEDDGQRRVKSEWSLPVHQTFLRDAEVMGLAAMAVTMRRREVLAQVSQWGDGYSGEGVGVGRSNLDNGADGVW